MLAEPLEGVGLMAGCIGFMNIQRSNRRLTFWALEKQVVSRIALQLEAAVVLLG